LKHRSLNVTALLGAPPEWRNRSPPFRLQPDTGVVFVDQGGYWLPAAPLLPLFRAVDVVAEENPDAHLDWGALDVITDRNNLRKLMRWLNNVDGTTKDFRIDMQLAGKKTLLLNRWEKRSREFLSGRSFGYAFEEATTKKVKGCEASTGHHRIVKYVCVCISPAITQILTQRLTHRIWMGLQWLSALKLMPAFPALSWNPFRRCRTSRRTANGHSSDYGQCSKSFKTSS